MFKDEIMVVDDETAFTLNQAAKLLRFDIGRTRLMPLFREWGMLLKSNEPAQSMIDRGYMLYHLKTIKKQGMPSTEMAVTLVTIKGLAYLRRIIIKKLKEQKNESGS